MDLYKRNGLDLPITRSPIRFAVAQGSGFISDAWGVQVQSSGDAYIYCRTAMRAQKVSLHCSGKQHISFNADDPSMQHYTGDRYMNQWWEPQHNGQAVPTLKIFFPTWALRLSREQRQHNQSRWNKNQVLIPAHEEMVTVVSFVIMDDGAQLSKKAGSPPSAVFGVLNLRPGKTLFVVAGYEPEGQLKARIGEALERAATTMQVPSDMREYVEGKDLGMCFTGYVAENCAFMLPLSVRYVSSHLS